jgi:hypothetical protein
MASEIMPGRFGTHCRMTIDSDPTASKLASTTLISTSGSADLRDPRYPRASSQPTAGQS